MADIAPFSTREPLSSTVLSKPARVGYNSLRFEIDLVASSGDSCRGVARIPRSRFRAPQSRAGVPDPAMLYSASLVPHRG